jgi:calcium/calmodulin-dependent 3',5'-cyclic nucleotide phosphodiesterase
MAKNDNLLSDLSKFTVVFSALCHDVGHTGYSNVFEIATLSEKTVMFNDSSVFLLLFSLYKTIIYS